METMMERLKICSEFLVCPSTGRSLILKDLTENENGEIDGKLVEPESGNEYPVVNSIPRFVPEENYSDSFGFQWGTHISTQHDSYSGVTVSGKRFAEETKWGNDLKGEIILEAGCGSGRFTAEALKTGASLISCDYSNAVDSNYKVNGKNENLFIIQADINNLPFRENFFDKTFCFGVLQHTPDPKNSFFSLLKHLKPGGRIATDIYLKSWRNYFHVKKWLRIFTKNMKPQKLYKFVKLYVNLMWPAAKIMRKTKLTQKMISRFVADRSDCIGQSDDSMLKEWAYLDTFDWLSPAYDNPKSLKTFRSWHEDAKLEKIEVEYGYNGVEARAVKSEH